MHGMSHIKIKKADVIFEQFIQFIQYAPFNIFFMWLVELLMALLKSAYWYER
jgi:hypothetical protein